MALRWRSDFEKYVIVHNFERRSKFWRRVDESIDDPNWNFYWSNVHNVRALFSPESGTRLGKRKFFVWVLQFLSIHSQATTSL
jgi:tubulin polyglutamylase TTLL1